MPNGFKLRGIAPYELRNYPDPVKLLFWGWALELGLKAKDRDLARGLDAKGEDLREISRRTREHRKSAMTPDGRGDPTAPPLMPGRKLSRTRSLLAGRAFTTHAEFYWRFDPWTHDTWAKILTYQKRQGRDVFGLSEESTDLVRRQALARWRTWLRTGVVPIDLDGKRVLAMGTLPQTPAPIPMAGRPIGPTSVFGIGRESAAGLKPGQWSGGFTESELKAHMREPMKVSIPGRPEGTYNRLLSHIWSGPTPNAGPVAPLTPPRPIAPRLASPASIALRPVTPVTKEAVEKVMGVKFISPAVARGNPEYTTVVVDVAKVEEALKRDPDKYVGPGGIGAGIRGRYEQFMRFLTRAKADKRPIEQPRATIAPDTGEVSITDGRHRFAVFRDLLARWLPFTVHKSDAAEMREKYGARK